MRFFEDIEIGAAARAGLVHLHRRGHQEIRRAIRSAALSSRRGGGPQIAVRRAGGIGLACRCGLHEAAGRRRPASGGGGCRARREGRGVGAVAGLSRTALDQAGAGRRHHQLFQRGRNASGRRRSVPNGASCRPATPAPTSAANWCSRSSRPPSCRGGMRAPEPARPTWLANLLRSVHRDRWFRGTNFSLTHFEPNPCHMSLRDRWPAPRTSPSCN